MSTTKIEWATDVWNPVTGCTKVSEGCRHCYAETVANRFWGDRKFTDVRCHDDRLDQPLHWRKPRRVFVNSMSDLFHNDVHNEFIAAVFGVMAACPQHTFMVLTKRPKRMVEWFVWLKEMAEQTADANREPMRDLWTMHVMMSCARNYGSAVAGCRVEWPLPNVIGMVSIEDQKTADIRVPLLLQSPFAVRGVSYEPALGHVDFTRMNLDGLSLNALKGTGTYTVTSPGLDWVICGGESGPGARPMHPDWARSLRDQCQAAGVPFFFKQWGEWAPGGFYSGVTIPDCLVGPRINNPRNYTYLMDPPTKMWRVGKKAAGRELDGRTWDEFPNV